MHASGPTSWLRAGGPPPAESDARPGSLNGAAVRRSLRSSPSGPDESLSAMTHRDAEPEPLGEAVEPPLAGRHHEGRGRAVELGRGPPSTARCAPVMQEASSESRNATAVAISSLRPMRPRGTPRSATSSVALRVGPGRLRVDHAGLESVDTHSLRAVLLGGGAVRPRMACSAEEYSTVGPPRSANTLDTLTIAPPPLPVIAGIRYLRPWKRPSRLIATTWRQVVRAGADAEVGRAADAGRTGRRARDGPRRVRRRRSLGRRQQCRFSDEIAGPYG